MDVEHLASLGSDAAPLLVDRLDELPGEARCVVATRLLALWGPERSPDWRSYNWSESRAREAVAERLEMLRSSAGPGRCG